MAAGLGLTVGPFMSGIVYSYLHYAGTFLFFAMILACTGCFLYLALPKRMNKSHNADQDDEDDGSALTKVGVENEPDEEKADKTKEISYRIFFNNHESCFILAACALCMIFLYHYETYLAVRLIQVMGLDEDKLGFFFCA